MTLNCGLYYCMIMFISFLDQYVKHKVIDVFIEREDGNLGIILRGGAHSDPDMCKPLTVTHVRSDGPADRYKFGEKQLHTKIITYS